MSASHRHIDSARQNVPEKSQGTISCGALDFKEKFEDSVPGLNLPWDGRAIILVDLDAFFASVEQLDHPGWKGKPVIVGGGADTRGVVSTASYEARTYGVHSAMPSSVAARLCPDAIWTGGNFARYREMSDAVMNVIKSETPYVMQVSVDEAFADITPTRTNREHPIDVVRRISRRISELGITCSIGLGTSKTVAKIASDQDKPNGLTIVYPGTEKQFLFPLPVETMSGIGKVATEKLHAHGIKTLGELAVADEALMKNIFGKNAEMMRNRAYGIDESEMETSHRAKSVSNEISFATDISSQDDVYAALNTVLAKVCTRLRRKDMKGSRLSVKVRYSNRSSRTSQTMLAAPSNNEYELIDCAREQLSHLWEEGTPLRLIGAGLSVFDEPAAVQEQLCFDADEDTVDDKSELLNAADSIRKRFGEESLRFGFEVKTHGSGTGTSAKNPEDYKD